MTNNQNMFIGSEEISHFKNKIKVQRAIHNLTQEQLAEKVGVSRQTIIAIENGKYLPSLGLAFKIADVFNVSIEEIFEYEKNI